MTMNEFAGQRSQTDQHGTASK